MTKTIDELREIPFKYMVTFEGTDCSFKETNAKQLVDYIQNELGYKAKLFSFPNYESDSSYLLRNYFKNTRHMKQLSPEKISTLYALDFYDSWYNKIKEYYDERLADRFREMMETIPFENETFRK